MHTPSSPGATDPDPRGQALDARLFEALPAALLQLDARLRVERFTALFAELFAAAASDLGRPFAELAAARALPGMLEDAQALARRDAAARERTLQGGDGRVWKVRMVPCPDPRGVLAAFTDMSDAIEAAGGSAAEDRRSLADSQRAAERAEQLASLGTLAAGIAHEINNPLNSILMNAELGLLALDARGGPDGDKLREVLGTVIEDVKRCSTITESVLKLSRKETVRPAGRHDINAVVRAARALVDSHLQMHDAAVELELADLPPVPLDPPAIERALVNLMRNAAEAGEGAVTVRVRTWRDEDSVVASVSDDGPGIPPEHLERLFDPFYSARRTGKGTGLGLSLVHRTVVDHAGRVEVTSEPGRGATFTLYLPIGPAAGDEPGSAP